MQLIECPWCGPREEVEFHYGGQAHVTYPEEPAALSDEQWAHFVFFRDNTKGAFAERWSHSARLPPLVQRDPRHRHLPLRARVPPRRAEAGDPMSELASESTAQHSFRTPAGGRVDRATTLAFTFDGEAYTGHPGDTLASALLAAGTHRIGTSVKLGRPRGITAAWAEDAGGLVQIEEPFPEPMLAGRPPWSSTTASSPTVCRARAGLADIADSARYDAVHHHVDVLVVGAGPAGLAAALSAARAGARVALVDEQSEAGGALLSGTERLDGAPALDWVAAAVAELAAYPEVLHLQRTTAFGAYDDGFVLALERRTDHLGTSAPKHLLPPAGVAHPGPLGRRRDRGARAPGRLRRQRPPGHHARGCRPHVPAPLRRARRAARSSCSPRTTAPTTPRSTCTGPACGCSRGRRPFGGPRAPRRGVRARRASPSSAAGS